MRNWYTSQELAGLPGLPGSVPGIRKLAGRLEWECRKRAASKAVEYPFAWRVNAPAVTITYAVAGRAAAGDPLASWGNKSLECRLSQMKPAESILLFGYGDD